MRALSDRLTTVRTLCFAVPAVVLAAAYLWMVVDHGTPWLGPVVVHEGGERTLTRTILYPDHFLREIPIVVAYVLFLLSASGHEGGWRPGAPTGLAAAILAGLLVVGALSASASSGGWDATLGQLLQYHTRDDRSAYGSHWRYHWLSTIWFGAAAGLAPAVVRRLTGKTVLIRDPSWARVAWLYVLALTVAFGLSTEVFTDVRYAGHQAREILTHGPVTLLVGLGLVLSKSGSSGQSRPSTPWATRVRIAAVVMVPLYLAAVSLSGDIMAEGQSELGLAAMVAAHYYEHTLDYLLAYLMLIGGLARARR